jgi:hypothetical protein
MSKVAEITVQPTQDPNVKAYHTRYEMAETAEEGFRGRTNEMGEFGKLFLQIRGVIHVHVSPYVLLVTKAPLFEWAEISPTIEEILKNFTRSQRLLNETLTDVRDEKLRIPGPSIQGKTPATLGSGKVPTD